LAPYAQIDDGLLDLILVPNVPEFGRKRMIDLLTNAKENSKHIYMKHVIYRRCKSVDIYFDDIHPFESIINFLAISFSLNHIY
jgi:diacylglycerol kinase family enzyme